MELSNINVQVKTPSNIEVSLKSSGSKDSKGNFSKVYKDIENQNTNDNPQGTNDNLQTKIGSLKEKIYSLLNQTNTTCKTPSLENIVPENTQNDEKDLNKLIELLLLSGNTNQNLMNLLTSSNNVDKDQLKEVLLKILKDNLSDNLSINANLTLSTMQVTSLNGIMTKQGSSSGDTIAKQESPIDKVTTKQESPTDEITKILLSNNGTLDESIDKLASDIADKLLTDKTYKADVLNNLLEKVQQPILDNGNSLSELILNELKEKTDLKVLLSDVDSKSTKASAIESIPVKAFKADLSSDLKNETLNLNNNNTEALNTKTEALNTDNSIAKALDDSTSKITATVNKPSDNTSTKEDLLLKQLVDSDSSKNNKDNISDKIANIVNRFETIRIDKPTITEGNILINKATFNEDVIKAVKFMDLNNLKELSVKIIPKDLGEIVIRLSMDNGVMRANITATNKDTYNLLNSQLPAISNQLSEQNMAIQNFSLSLYNGDNFLFNGNGSNNQKTGQQSKSDVKAQIVEDIDTQNEQYFDDPSSINTLA